MINNQYYYMYYLELLLLQHLLVLYSKIFVVYELINVIPLGLILFCGKFTLNCIHYMSISTAITQFKNSIENLMFDSRKIPICMYICRPEALRGRSYCYSVFSSTN